LIVFLAVPRVRKDAQTVRSSPMKNDEDKKFQEEDERELENEPQL